MPGDVYTNAMTARQIIDEIKAMNPEERGQVAEFLRQLEMSKAGAEISEQRVDEIADQILDRHAELMRKLAE